MTQDDDVCVTSISYLLVLCTENCTPFFQEEENQIALRSYLNHYFHPDGQEHKSMKLIDVKIHPIGVEIKFLRKEPFKLPHYINNLKSTISRILKKQIPLFGWNKFYGIFTDGEKVNVLVNEFLQENLQKRNFL